MLACVSTLVDVVSYEEVRHSKEWLTTNELFSFVRDNCPNLHGIIDPEGWGSHYLRAYKLSRTDEELRALSNRKWDNVARCYRMPAFGKDYIRCVIVTDNGCRPVRFYSKQTIVDVENHIVACVAARQEEIKQSRRRALWERVRLAIWHSSKCRTISKYQEHTFPVWGSFYDPEWFAA